MSAYIAEVIGTAILCLLGGGVCANANLKNTYGHSAGWLFINIGWGLAVFAGVFCTAAVSGAHLNPAVTLGLAMVGKFSWSLLPGYMIAQFIGAAIGALLVWLQYRDHFDQTEEDGAILGTFATGPAIRNPISNLISETLGTFVLVFGVLSMASPDVGLGALDAIPVAFLVIIIGAALGGTTGYAINPARDFSPRLIHSLLPIRSKGDSDWGYAWIPIVGPLLGGAIAALLYTNVVI